MERKIVVKDDIVNVLKSVGIASGDVVMVHTSLSSLGFVCGGAQVVNEALTETITSKGTIVMPTQTWKNLDPTVGVHWEEPKEWWQIIRDNWPAYQKEVTPTNTMGAVAEMFRQWPGAKRSDHPARSVAAWGQYAEEIVKDHDLSDIFGETSPLAKLYQHHAKVLLLGVGYDKNTSLHLADVRAKYPGKHMETNYSAMMVNGKREWVRYETLYVDGEDFPAIGEAYEFDHMVKKAELGNGIIRCMDMRDLVDFAITWIEKNRR